MTNFPDFTAIDYDVSIPAPDPDAWRANFEAETGSAPG